jgi:hypothetical protein
LWGAVSTIEAGLFIAIGVPKGDFLQHRLLASQKPPNIQTLASIPDLDQFCKNVSNRVTIETLKR